LCLTGQPAGNRLDESRLTLNPAFMAGEASFCKRRGAQPMPVFKYFTVVGLTLLVFLFGLDTYFADKASNLRFNGSFYESATYAPRLEEAMVELRFTRDATPTERVKEVFGQFVPNENRRGKRYTSAATTVIR
jgi:hypothetical protein